MKRILTLIWIVALLCFSGACQTDQELKKEPDFKKWRKLGINAKAKTPSRKITGTVVREKRGTLKASAVRSEQLLPQKKTTIKLNDIDVAVALRAVARAADQNIMINQGVAGKISLDVKEVPWDQVFKGILKTHGLTYEWTGNVIRVMTYDELERDQKRNLQTRIVAVEYADAAKLRDNLQSILSGTPPASASSGSQTPAPAPTGAVTLAAPGATNGSQEGLGATVLVDEHTNSLIIQGTPSEINRLMPIIAAIDKPTSQILIEAHIVEATKEVARMLGVRWGGLINGDRWSVGQPPTTGVTPGEGIVSNFPARLPSDGTGLNIGFLGRIFSDSSLAFQLSALQENGKLNILSSPSITTLDNQVALIESGQEVPFQTVDADGNVVIEWKKAVLKLEVTPHVIDGENLKLKIVTKKDELDFTNAVLGNPTILTKNAETGVILKDGETTVIGGLNKETITREEAGIPGLKDVPVAGYLFKNKGKEVKLEDVLIFITPHILEKRSEAERRKPPDAIDYNTRQEPTFKPEWSPTLSDKNAPPQTGQPR